MKDWEALNNSQEWSARDFVSNGKVEAKDPLSTEADLFRDSLEKGRKADAHSDCGGREAHCESD